MLSGRVAVITGGASGIGRAIANRFAREGCKVCVADIDEEKGDRTVRHIRENGGNAIFERCDTSDEEAVKRLMSNTVSDFGALNILVNNAVSFVFGHMAGEGGSGTGTDKEISNEDWERVWNVNVLGYARTIKHAVPYMKQGEKTRNVFEVNEGADTSHIDAGSVGTIVNVASVSGFIAQPEFVPYNTSKGAVMQLTRCNAMDLARHKIRVNAVCPGTIETGGSYNHMKLIGLTVEEGRKEFASGNCMKRQAAPEEVANGVLFLASDESSFMTGSSIVIDGGETI